MSRGTIAVDLDDVLAATNAKVAEIHNEMFGTDMSLDDFDYYLWWRNKYWGDISETIEKVKAIYAADLFSRVQPVTGAQDGCNSLKKLGYRLIIITARSEDTRRVETERWIERYFSGVFDEIWFSGEFVSMHRRLSDSTEEENRKHAPAIKCGQTKSEILRQTGAMILIDDSLEHAIDLARAEPPLETILFGPYKWNRRESRLITDEDKLGYEQRIARGLKMGPEFKLDTLKGYARRANDWSEVVRLLST